MLSLAGKRLLGIGVIITGIVLLVVGVSRPDPFTAKTTYYAEMDNVQGLGAVGRDIRVAGTNVGTIGSVERQGDNAIITLEIEDEKGVVVKEDARVDMRPHTLFEGSSLVELTPGSPSAEPLPEGSTIPISQTSNYVTIDEALRILRPEIRENLRELAEVGANTLRGKSIDGIQKILKNGPELLKNTKRPVRELQGSNGEELASAIEGMAETVDAVAKREAELIPLSQRLNRTMAALAIDDGAALDRSLAALPGATSELRQGAPTLTALVDRLDRFAVEVNPALPDLAPALREATPLLKRTIPILEDTTPIVRDLRKISGRIADSSPTIADLIRSVDPVADIFGDSVLPVLLNDSRNGEPTYEQLMALFSAANGVFRPYQTPAQGSLGSGHIWNLGVYLEPLSPRSPTATTTNGAGYGTLVDCVDVERIDIGAAKQLEATGMCTR